MKSFGKLIATGHTILSSAICRMETTYFDEK